MFKHITSYLILIVIICLKPIITENLENHHQNNYLDPINEDYDSNENLKEQSKRTIFGNSLPNYGWAKHVAIHPSGSKYVLGYGAVDLKYVPVARPLAFKPIHRPKWQKPSLIKPSHHHHHSTGWKPVVPIVKPPINVPPVYGLPNKPPIWQQNGWNQPLPIKPSKPLIPVHEPSLIVQKPVNAVSILPSKPLIPVNPPVPVFSVRPPIAVSVVPSTPVRPIITPIPAPVHPVPIHPVPAPVPIHPVATPVHPVYPPPLKPLFPSPLFEVTKPNLPVLPFGAVFPSPVLQNPPIRQLPLPVHHPVAGTTFEFHGTNKFIPVIPPQQQLFPQLVPAHHHPSPAFVPQIPHSPPVFLQQIPQSPPPVLIPQIPHSPPALIPQISHHHHQVPVQVPHEQHDVQTPLIPQNHPLFQHQQQQFDLINQQHHQQQQQQQHFIGNESHGNDQQIVIQPGQTDLQFPLHLPQHPNYLPPNHNNDRRQFQTEFIHQSGNVNDFGGNAIRPSISLEPPFT